MISRKRKRLNLIILGLTVLAMSAVLIGFGMRDGIEFFKSPSQVALSPDLEGRLFRVGGLVKADSIKQLSDGAVSFIVHDNAESIVIKYRGILPSLFAENQGVIVRGTLNSNKIFIADEVLAKHDENYLPKEIIESLKSDGLYVEPTLKKAKDLY